MCLFVGFMLFWMAFRSLMYAFGGDDMARKLKMYAEPDVGLPMLNGPDESGEERGDTERVMEALDSAWVFFRPWPGPRTRRTMNGYADLPKFALVWASTRLHFLETLTGTEQGWGMFTPDCSTQHVLPRARLFYADGEERLIRGPAEPRDLTRYGHGFNYLREQIEQDAERGYWKSCEGYCTILGHRYPRNEAGSPLVRIRLYEVVFRFPPPGVDPVEFMQKQQRDVEDGGANCSGDYYEYDVASGKGRDLQ
jgi:hypothetical protein